MAWSDIPTIVKSILYRFWGDQTSEQAKIQRATDEAKAELFASMREGNVAGANAALDRLWELRDKAAATRSKRD